MKATLSGLTIPAKIYSDDCAKYAEFDASGWFASAEADKIVELAHNGWSGAVAANHVARFAQNADDGVAAVLQYAMYLRHGGLRSECTCTIDRVAALEWLAYRRPGVLARLRQLPHVA